MRVRRGLTFNLIGNNNSPLFSTQPAISSGGTLTFTPAPGASGSATLSVQLQDDGLTANGGHDTSSTATFAISTGIPGGTPNTVGTLTAGSQNWSGGGYYSWDLNNATGTAGAASGWDLVDITGDLRIQATSGSKFTIKVVSLDGTSSGPAANFNCRNSYRWTIARVSGTIQSFDLSKFSIDTSGFLNFTGGGTFSVEQSGSALILVFAEHACISGETTASWNALGGKINIIFVNPNGIGTVEGLRYINCTESYTAFDATGRELQTAVPMTEFTSYPLLNGTVRVEVVGTRVTFELKASCNARVSDLCGQWYATIDPVTTQVQIGENGRDDQTFTAIPSAEHYLNLRNDVVGLTRLQVWVNGRLFDLKPLTDGQTTSLDIGSAMNPGEDNIVRLVGEGPVGASAVVTIGDTPGGEPMAADTPIALEIEPGAGFVVLSWPDQGAGYILQSASGTALQWQDRPEPPQSADGRLLVKVPTTQQMQWFRLYRP